ncbi:MAG: 5'-methylthioadenosine/adenosylhomocysteine nucleosidase [Lachnospiraceae bacterium]|nr:5'-methylthioadenosine/adenosylhomocysteine nucleosidase [Lachnospiraceae bacterium]
MLGIICAMDEEMKDIKERMVLESEKSVAGMVFLCGTIEGKECCLCRSGIGKVNAAICAQIMIDCFGVDNIINTGIAGGLDPSIHVGDMVISSDVLHHDMDTTAFGYPYGQVPRMDVLSFEADRKLIDVAKSVIEEACRDHKTFVGRIVSGDQFVADKAKKDFIRENFDALCTEMEGAAIGHCAYVNGVPYVVIRAISDNADDSAGMDYNTFEKMAIERLVDVIVKMVVRL